MFIFSLDVCNSPPGTYMMCPLCDESLGCHPVDLHTSCMLGKVCDFSVHQNLNFSLTFMNEGVLHSHPLPLEHAVIGENK